MVFGLIIVFCVYVMVYIVIYDVWSVYDLLVIGI